MKLELEFFDVNDKLPNDNEYVLIYLDGPFWYDGDASHDEHFYKVAKFRRGISLEERKRLRNSSNPVDVRRSNTIMGGDEWGNNSKPYEWEEFGDDSWNGQEVLYWARLPIPSMILKELNKEES